ncbi:serine protease inhibitor Cvsi-2-like [Mytilus californianus]|uniref:serine protease inhibitor Cvsi-2-like n=1 Tax=Mytilus californianus TaxID=6549 RepID=UPI0022487373|nr:serine protease inhibitor Cvsi-2-like [Mytilus californianus]
MKVVLCFALVFLVAVYAENCKQAGDCSVTQCSQGSLTCIDHRCTCATNTGNACTIRDDCHQHCQKHGGRAHCVDGSCTCQH